MAFTEYLPDYENITALVAEKSASLKASRGLSDLLGFGLGIVRTRLAKDPRRYRDYGPYWWALKSLLNDKILDYGKQSDPMTATIYKGRTPVETLVLADEFRNAYIAKYFIYTNQLVLDGETGEFWTLFDSEMELLPPIV